MLNRGIPATTRHDRVMSLFFPTALLAGFVVAQPGCTAHAPVRTGVDVLIADDFEPLRGRRVGLGWPERPSDPSWMYPRPGRGGPGGPASGRRTCGCG